VAFNNLGWIANYRAEFESARASHTESLALRRQIGDRRGEAFALTNLAWTEQRSGNLEQASALLEEASAILRDVKDALLWAWANQMRAAVLYDQGEFRQAAQIVETCFPVWRRAGNRSGLGFGAYYFALASARAGDFQRALDALAEGEASVSRIPQRWGQAVLKMGRARILALRGDNSAVSGFNEAHTLLTELGDRRCLA